MSGALRSTCPGDRVEGPCPHPGGKPGGRRADEHRAAVRIQDREEHQAAVSTTARELWAAWAQDVEWKSPVRTRQRVLMAAPDEQDTQHPREKTSFYDMF